MPSAPPPKSEKSSIFDSISPWSTSRSSTPRPTVAAENESGAGSKTQQGSDHTVTHQHGLSSRRYPRDCPPLNPRWWYAVDSPKRKPKLLKETSADSKPLPAPKKFVTFSPHDSKAIEQAYQRLVEDEEDGVRRRENDNSHNENTSINEAGNVKQAGSVTVPVNEDYLFDVDVERRELAPVYWLGPIYEVRRGTWFYQEGSVLKPCEENLALQLEEGYLKVKPFRYPKHPEKPQSRPVSMKPGDDLKPLGIPSAKSGSESEDATPRSSVDGLRAMNHQALESAVDGTKDASSSAPHQPQTHRLFGSHMNSIVTYQDDTVAWLSSDGIMSRVSSTVYQRFAGGGYLGGVKCVRGFRDPGKLGDAKPDNTSTPSAGLQESNFNPALQLDERQQRLLKRRSAPPGTGSSMSLSEFDSLKADLEPKQPETREATLERQMSSIVTDTIDMDAGEEAVRRRDEKEIQHDYQDHDGEVQSREIDHLCLISHGVGQRLGMRTESVNFVHDVNVLRQTLKSVYSSSADLQALNSEIDKLPKNCRIQVLPVCWRHLLDFPRQGLRQNRKEHDLGEEFGDDEEYPSLEDITVEGVPFVRSLITDLALDVLLYQSSYREHITRIVKEECNRVYRLFMERNPNFKGKVSLVGHSLGSAILFDILCRQKEDLKIQSSTQHQKYYHNRPAKTAHHKKDEKDLSFEFNVEDFYCLGSPIGLFQMLKGRTIAARHNQPDAVAESPMDPDYMDDPFLAAGNSASYSAGEKISSTTGLPFTISSPKCAQLYNIFHPSDPIAYRLEPLISPAMSSLKPQALPYTKKGIFGVSASQGLTGIGAKVGQSVSGFWSTLSGGIASSLLNRSLGLTGEDVASMTATQNSSNRNPSLSVGAGTNISGGVISDTPTLSRENTNEKKRQLAEDMAAADRDGRHANAPTLIDDDIETLYAGFQKRRESRQEDGEQPSRADWAAAEEKSKKLRREELKVRGLNQTGRVDFNIQEGMIDLNPLTIIASHLSYWGDEDVAHFVMSQLLSRHRASKRGRSADHMRSFKI